MLLGLVGLLLIFLEVLFVSMGALGIAATGCLLGSIFLAFQESVSFGIGVTVFEAIAAPVVFWSAFKILPKTPFGRHLILTGPPTEGTAGAADHRLDGLVGKSGTALSALRPAGFARSDGRTGDVVVLEVSANRVVVGAAAKATAAP
jgi:membrane-bound serine protease (ClpP class)